MTKLQDAKVLITGAGGGFGREMMRQFAAKGSTLLLHDLNMGLIEAAQAEVPGLTASVADVYAADLSDEAGCRELFANVGADGHVPDILVNNAGIGVGGRFDIVPADRWEQVIQINLLSPMRLCQHFLPAMIERRSGHIVNISSVAGIVGAEGLASYVASKFGLRGFSESLQNDMQAFDIRISTVYPWFSRTPILDSEQFGPGNSLSVPDGLVTDPADVVAAIVDGVIRDKRNIFPDAMSRRIDFIKRHLPWMLPLLMRKMRGKVEAAQ